MPLPFNPSDVFNGINAVRILTGSKPKPENSSRVQDYDRLISRLDDLKNSMMEQSPRKPEAVQEPSAVEEYSDLPTTDETIQDLKRRLGKELYRIELDLQDGGRIAGKPCRCLCEKHNLGIEATVEELIAMDSNPVYGQILQWFKDHEPQFCPTTSQPPEYYHSLTPEVRAFRKAVMGTETLRALLSPSVVAQVEQQAQRVRQGEITQEEGMSELEEWQKSSQTLEEPLPKVTGKLVTRSYRTPVGIVVDFGIRIGDTVYEPRASAVSPIGVSETKKGWSEVSEKDRENYRGWEKKQGAFGNRARAIVDIERRWDEIIAKGKTSQEHAKEQLASYESYIKRRAEAERQYSLKLPDLLVGMALEEIATGNRYIITEITDEGGVYARPENEPAQSGGSIGHGEVRGYRIAIQRAEALPPNAEAASKGEIGARIEKPIEEVDALSYAPPGPRWEGDMGAQPGEPVYYLDGIENPKAAIIEIINEQHEVLYQVVTGKADDARTLGIYNTLGKAAQRAEDVFPFPKAEATIAPAVKEDWQMTQEEFLTLVGYKKSQGSRVKENWRGQHEGIVRVAIQNRKPVPAAVLKDYPDLAKATYKMSGVPSTK